jgi:hypothetical protein
MRTIIAVVIVLVAGIASAAWLQVGTGAGPAKVTVDAASASGATVTVEVPGIEAESVAINGVQYVKLAIPGAVSAVLDVGKPEVPAVPVLLARPTGSTVSLRILSMQTETLHVANVFPMQPSLKLGEQAGPLAFDSSFYASDVEYPSDRLSSPITATWRDLDVVNIHVYPVAVRPAQHEVVVTSRITFRVDFSGGHYPKTVASWMQPMYRSLIDNYEKLGLATAGQEPPGTKCLVFCHQEYANNPDLVALLDTMTKLGDSTEIISVDDGVSPGAIKAAIIDRYNNQNKALHWVLLVGEYDEIPPKQGYIQPGWGIAVPYSDYWYSDWGLSNDTILCDDYPEVGIARLSPSDSQDLSNQIAKIRAYMMGTDAGDWLNKTTLVAHRDDEPTLAVRRAAKMSLGFYPGITRDTFFGYKGASNTDVKGSVEQGTGVLIYLGSGLPDGTGWMDWDTLDEDWTNGEVLGLENSCTPVVFNIACHCGNLSQGTCLSEQWMRKYSEQPVGLGAVASFGCSGWGWAEPADTQCIVAVRATGDYWSVPQHGEYHAPVFDLGGIQMLMGAYVAKLWPPNDSGNPETMNIYSFMWLGNPAMPVWSGGTPEAATVSYPSRIPTGLQSFTVTVTIDNQPVEGAQVCVYKPDDFYVVGLTEADGEVTLTLDASSEDTFYVSASKGHERLNTPGVAHTPMLPYFGKSVVSDSGLCSTPDMTYPNWSRKLARDPSNGILHLAYTASNMVCYKQSSDGGATWSTPETVGPGMYPAVVSLGWIGVPGSGPWVVYVTPQGSIIRAIRMSPGSWNQAVVFLATDSKHAGAPSAYPDYVAIPYVNVFVAYPVDSGSSPTYSSIRFNVVTQASVSQPQVVDGPFPSPVSCYGASVVANPAAGIHVCWIRNQSVYYSQRTMLTPWTIPRPISTPVPDPIYVTEPASNPSMEAWGDNVYCAWRGPYDATNLTGEVYRRDKWLGSAIWDPVARKSSSSELESDFPAIGTYYATFWHEEVTSTNYDPWVKRENHMPEYVFQTSQMSRYLHVYCYFPTMTSFACDAVWTEQVPVTPPKYEVRFGTRLWGPLNLASGNGSEIASYYEVKLGQPTPSPYCLSRGGYGNFDSWNADTSGSVLSYQLPYLDPRMVYKLRAILYHKGKESWDADVRCDSGPWHRIRVGQNVPDTIWLQVPKALYKDGRIVVDVARASGDYVSLAGLKLYQLEPKPDGREGVQSMSVVLGTRLLTCAPNPLGRATTVSYEIARGGTVALSVHDVSGRLVRRIEDGFRSAGPHAVAWNGTDGRGMAVPAGVYFVRFCANGVTQSRRVTLVR